MSSSLNPPIEITIDVRIRQQTMGYGEIHLNETIQVPETDFLGLAAIMKRFHDLAVEIQAKRVGQ